MLYRIQYKETYVGYYDVEASTKEEAEKKFNNMMWNAEVDYDMLELSNSEIKAVAEVCPICGAIICAHKINI